MSSLCTKMKLGNSNLVTICFAVCVVLSFTVPAEPQISDNEFPIPVESQDQDFIVKFKGEMFSWKNLSQLLRQHNITVPHEKDVLAAVLKQKKPRAQSCEGRCFLDERKYSNKTCFCDMACKIFSDCCLDFYSRCGQTGNGESFQNMACGDINEQPAWIGVIMRSSCGSIGHHSTSECQPIKRLNMTLQKELPVFSLRQSITYRSIACAKCSNEGNLSFWGLDISCKRNWSITTPVSVTAVKRFLKEHPDYCSWKYAPLQNREQQYRSCVLHDTQCVTNHQPVMSVVKELCYSYSMVFSVVVGWPWRELYTYRNPHCALCNPEEKPKLLLLGKVGYLPGGTGPWSILLSVRPNILDQEERENSQPEAFSVPAAQDLSSPLLNCTPTTNTCKVTFGGQICEVSNSSKNQTANRVILVRQRHVSFNATDLQGNKVFISCWSELEPLWVNKGLFLHYFTLVGLILSIISLCFLLSIYLSFKELRNLPGKCLMNLSLALLCQQSVFLGAGESRDKNVLCKAVAIFLHFFSLAAFSWMSVMAFDTRNTFTVKVCNTRRQLSDIRKTFIKYCIVGWGLPAVVVVLCCVLDFTGTFHFGYGNSTFCWISDKKAIAVTMVIPVSFAMIFNTVCLLKNARVIRRLQQGASLATNNSSRPSLTLICIKLTTIMGLTWILGLIANWKQTAFLWYPFTVLNSLQGFFIALCFITTKKVRSLLKKRFCNRWNGAVEPQANVDRDQFAGNTRAKTIPGSNMFEMNCLSIEQARQNSP